MRMFVAFVATLALGAVGWAADPPAKSSAQKVQEAAGEAAAAELKHDAVHKNGHKDDHAGEHKDGIMDWKWDTAVWTCVVFLLLFFILSKYAWTPILDGLKAREKSIANVMDEAKRLREENARDAAKFKAELDAAFAKIPAMMEEARRDAAALKESIRAEGNAEVLKERQRLLRELDIARDQALQDIWNQAASVGTLIASKAIGRSLTTDDHRRLVDEAIDELKAKAAAN